VLSAGGMKVARLAMVIPFGLLAACAGGAVDAPRPREPLPIPSATSAVDASIPLPALSSAVATVAPNSVVLLVTANNQRKCVELVRSPATEATSPVTLSHRSASLTAGTACRPATLSLALEKDGDAELLSSAQLRVTPVRLPGAMGRPAEVTEMCPAVERTLRPYPSAEACEAARVGEGAPSVSDRCVQGFVDRAFAPDPRLDRLHDAALVRAMRESGNLFVITGKVRQCLAWTFHHGSTDDFHGHLQRRFTRKQGKEDVTWGRSYAYDPTCKAFGLSGYSVAVSTKAGGNGSATSDTCKVTGLLERANADAIDVGDRTLFLTEAACTAAARAPASRPTKGAASPYVADDEGC
jgi:hypothetical protein